MSNYTPDTEEVRNMYSSPSWVTAAQESERYGEFDDWLKEIRAEAWAEGWSEGFGNARDEFDALSLDDNPYHSEADDA